MQRDQDPKVKQAIQAFTSQQISVLAPGDPLYRRAIATSNLLFRFSRPDCVVRPKDAGEVQAIIREATKRSIKVTIKCNGHSYAGHSTAFRGISLDLRSMKQVDLDMDNLMVTMDAGCQWGDVYEKLVMGRHDRYIINGGRCPTVGVSGFTLGGGLGPFTRTFGMGSDTLAEATLITAGGKKVVVKESDPPDSDRGRLFWALRGAGGGNFGVVVQMKLHVQKLRNRNGTVVAGRYQWYPEPPIPKPGTTKSDTTKSDTTKSDTTKSDTTKSDITKSGITDELIDTMNAFYATDWPPELTIDSTWICDLRDTSNQGGVRFTIAFDGPKTEYDRLITQHIQHTDLQRQLKRRVLPEPSTRFLYETLFAQWIEETERAYPTNKTYELYSSFVFTRSSPFPTITAIIRDLMGKFRKDFKGEKVNFLVTWIHTGGKASEPRNTDTAYFWREALFHVYVTVEWVDKWMELDMRLFLATIKKKLRPLSLSGEAAFVNFPDRDFPTKLHERAYFGDNKDKLREVKQRWDPDGFFTWSQGVRRPTDPDEDEDPDDDEDRTDRLASEQWNANTWSYYEPDDLDEELENLAEELGPDDDEF